MRLKASYHTRKYNVLKLRHFIFTVYNKLAFNNVDDPTSLAIPASYNNSA
jgi:hypothetical protein